jgi:hypothetical protein
MKDLQKKYSKKIRYKVNKVKARGGIERSLGLTVTHIKLHEKLVIEEEKNIEVKIFPDFYRNWKNKNAPRKYFLTLDFVNIEEIASPLMLAEK